MGFFCTAEEHENFLRVVPRSERETNTARA